MGFPYVADGGPCAVGTPARSGTYLRLAMEQSRISTQTAVANREHNADDQKVSVTLIDINPRNRFREPGRPRQASGFEPLPSHLIFFDQQPILHAGSLAKRLGGRAVEIEPLCRHSLAHGEFSRLRTIVRHPLMVRIPRPSACACMTCLSRFPSHSPTPPRGDCRRKEKFFHYRMGAG